MTVTVTFPLHLKNTLNRREHWAAKARRAKAERGATTLMLKSHGTGYTLATLSTGSFWPSVATFTRQRLAVRLVRVYAGKSQAMDDDGLSAAFKHCRDAVAAYFGLDDADPRIRFGCAQERGAENAVRLEFNVEAL